MPMQDPGLVNLGRAITNHRRVLLLLSAYQPWLYIPTFQCGNIAPATFHHIRTKLLDLELFAIFRTPPPPPQLEELVPRMQEGFLQ